MEFRIDVCWVLWILVAYAVFLIFDRLLRMPYVLGANDRCFFITGCDSGFGKEIAKRLDEKGCTVFAGCLTEKGEVELKKQSSGRLHTVPLDVTNSESIRNAYDYVTQHVPPGKGLSGLLNNAGIMGRVAPVEWLIHEDYLDVFNVNYFGLVDMTVTFLPLIKKEHGRVVNMSSVSGRISLAYFGVYAASKHSVEAFSDALRRQLRDYKCTVHILEPGAYKTRILSPEPLLETFSDTWARLGLEMKQEYGGVFYEKRKKEIVMVTETFASERISDVVEAQEHALLGMFPRARYTVGNDAKFLWLPLQWLPEWLADWILERMSGKDRPISAATGN